MFPFITFVHTLCPQTLYSSQIPNTLTVFVFSIIFSSSSIKIPRHTIPFVRAFGCLSHPKTKSLNLSCLLLMANYNSDIFQEAGNWDTSLFFNHDSTSISIEK